MYFDVSLIVAFNFARDVGLKNRPTVMHICMCILCLGTYFWKSRYNFCSFARFSNRPFYSKLNGEIHFTESDWNVLVGEGEISIGNEFLTSSQMHV